MRKAGYHSQSLLVLVEVFWRMCMAMDVKIHYITKGMWTPARGTSHSKIMGINRELVIPLLL